MKNALILYYSQAGQTQRAVEMFAKGVRSHMGCDVARIVSSETFAFPWTMTRFFRVFPRAVRGLAPAIEPLNIDWTKYDLVILGYQVWFLSPSLPIQGFLHAEEACGLRDKQVITLLTCRNLWQSALVRVQASLQALGARFLGQVTICELSPVWASFVTTPRWMLTGRKNGFLGFPPAGIGDAEFDKIEAKASRIAKSWVESNGQAVVPNEFRPNITEVSLVLMDRIGAVFFKFWAGLILRLAPNAGARQDFLLILFRLNLITLILSAGPCTRIFQFLVGNDPKWSIRFAQTQG